METTFYIEPFPNKRNSTTNSSPSDAGTKKRKRLAVSCQICRKRKIKCDKKRPKCNVCIKNGVGHLCDYQEPSWNVVTMSKTPEPATVTPEFQIQHELEMLRAKVLQLEKNQTAKAIIQDSNLRLVNFCSGYASVYVRAGRLSSYGTLNFVSLIRADPFLNVTLAHIRREKRQAASSWASKDFAHIPKSKQELMEQLMTAYNKKSVMSAVDNHFSNKFIENEGLDPLKVNPVSIPNLINGSAAASQNDDHDVSCSAAQDAKPHVPEVLLGPSTFSKINHEAEVVATIYKVLPEKEAIWQLMDQFFRSRLYAFAPCVTEEMFYDKIEQLLGDKSVPVKLNITRRFDFAYIGILLIIMRLAYLSAPERMPEVSTDVIEAAQMCLNLYKLLRRAMLPVLQCSLFMRFYNRFAPEDGDLVDGGNSEIFTGLLVQMSKSIGLHMDLTRHSAQLHDEAEYSHMWRKCWYEVWFLDVYQARLSGNSTLISDLSYDTKLPSEGPSNARLAEVEQATIQRIALEYTIGQATKPLFVLTSSQLDCEIGEVLARARQLELAMYENLGKSLQEIIELPNQTYLETVMRTAKFILYVDSSTTLAMLYYHLFLVDNAHLAKVMYIYNELIYLGTLLSSIDSYFDAENKFLVMPSCEQLFTRLALINRGILSRCLDYKYNYLLIDDSKADLPGQPDGESWKGKVDVLYGDNAQRRVIVDEIISQAFARWSQVNKLILQLSSTYFQTWRISKVETYLYNLLKNETNNIYDRNSKLCLFYKNTADDENNPYYKIPKVNFLKGYSLNDLKNISSFMNTSSTFEDRKSLSLSPMGQEDIDNQWYNTMFRNSNRQEESGMDLLIAGDQTGPFDSFLQPLDFDDIERLLDFRGDDFSL